MLKFRLVFRRLLILGVLMRDVLTTCVELLGCVLVVVGVAMLSVPIAVVTAGVLLILLSWLVTVR